MNRNALIINPMPSKRALAYRLGWLPDVPDQRDIPFGAVFRVPAKVPATIDLRRGCSPVEQQGQLGSCTAQALVGALEFLELSAIGSARGGNGGAAGGPRPTFADLSRLFVYYNERAAMGTTREDSGAMLRAGIKVLKKLGVCREDKWPYIVARFAEKPPPKCYRAAAEHQVTAYQRLATLPEMKACLAMGLPFVFGFAVYEHVLTENVRRSGQVRLPRRGERMRGGHAVMAVGYDEQRKIFFFRNSWGAAWGKNGYGALPYAYAESRELSDDFWCIQAVESNLYARWLLPTIN